MDLEFLLAAARENPENDALVWCDRVFSYQYLLDSVGKASEELRQVGIVPGSIVSLEADFSPVSVAMMLALIQNDCIIVPLTDSVRSKKEKFRAIAEVEWILRIDGNDQWQPERTANSAAHALLLELKQRQHPGLILFSSGSTGESKAALHDLMPMLQKFRVRRHTRKAITFLLFDHIGGFNTLMYNLSNAGCTVTIQDRSPESVCRAIERFDVELLPTSPTFLNLFLASESYRKFDLSSLQLVTYGTEVMPTSTLSRFCELFPNVRLQQTYGLSEIGILRSKSRSSDSVWVKLGGEGFETRVVEGKLEVKAKSAMMGYLNAPSPFTDDGWFITGDVVEVDGEYFRILGRESEIINVGGEKVYPAEIEGVLEAMPGVQGVVVRGEKHPITGQIVTALVKLDDGECEQHFRRKMRLYCKDRLDRYKIPQKVQFVDQSLHGDRFKKMRKSIQTG